MATIGQQIDHYRIERLLGEGGMGGVYLAKDLNLQREIALKVMSDQFASQKQFQLRFIQEARAAGDLKHDNIVLIYDCDLKDGQLFIAMEYIKGGSLREYVHRQTASGNHVDLDTTVEMVRQLASALHYAHQRQMIHRDIKPDNILLKEMDGPEGPKKWRPILTDFGLAKLAQGGMLDTALGEAMGTPEYMSPEQCTNQKVDGRSDIYALGVLLYEMVTGQVPFPFRNMHDAIRDHTQTPVPSIRKLRDIDVELENIILTCLEKDPKDRYQTASELARELEQFQNRPVGGDALIGTQLAEEEPSPPAVYAGPVNIVIKDGGREDTRYFDQDSITIGRHDDQNLKLVGDKRVSRRHARITRSAEAGYQIIDLGSGNGTQVNDQSLAAHVPTALPLGAVVEIGPCTLRLEKAEPHAAVQYDDPLMTRLDDLPSAPPAMPPAAAAPPTPPPTRASSAYETGQYPAAQPPATRVNPNPQPQPPRTRVNPNPNPQPPVPPAAGDASDAINVSVDTMRIVVMPTSPPTPTFLNVTVLNQSHLVDHFFVQVMGVPEDWVRIQTGELRLMPGDKGMANISFLVPRASTSTAGEHAIELQVTARKQNLQPKVLNLTILVQPYYDYNFTIEPTLVKRRGKTLLLVENKGNSSNTYNLSANDPAHDLDFEMGERQITLRPGEELPVPIKITPKQRPFIGSKEMKPFEVNVATSMMERPPMPKTGNLVVYPRFPRWPLFILPLLLALCALLTFAFLNNRQEQQATATALTAVVVQRNESADATATAVADPDGDGLATFEEQQKYDTDPFNPDTDGDGLLDGEEVKEHGTDPKNKDTDGDTLEDGEEVAAGCLSPTNRDTDGDTKPDNVEFNEGTACTSPTATETPRPTLPPELANCPDSPEARLRVGDRGQVEPGGRPNRLRGDPSTDADLIEPRLQPGTRFTVVGGPTCNQAEGGPLIRFWQVNASGRIGWTAEGWLDDDQDEDKYYLEPLPEE